MSRYFTVLGGLILFLPASVSLALHGYLGSFNRLLADDFCSAHIAHRLGFLRSIWFWYLNWSGGYSQSIADFTLEIIGQDGMPYVVPVFLSVWFLVAMLAVLFVLPAEINWGARLWISITISAVIIFSVYSISPNVPQGLYWWGSMRKYGVSLMIFTLYVVVYQLFNLKDRGRWGSVVGCLTSFSIIFLNSGFSETFTPLQIVFLALALGLGLWSKYLTLQSQALYFLAAGLAGAVVGLAIMLAAPGNSIRASHFPAHPGLLEMLTIAVNAYLAFLASLFSATEKVLGLLAVILAGIWVGVQINIKVKISPGVAISALLLGFAFVFGCFLPAAYGLSEAAPGRSLVVAVYFLVLSFLVAGAASGIWLSQMGYLPTIAKPAILVGLALCMIFPAWSNIQHLYTSRETYITYARQWDAMDAQILAAKADNQSEVHIPAKRNWADVFEPSDNPNFYVTMCMSEYYDIQVLVHETSQP